MNPKTLLQVALARLDQQQFSQLLERSGLEFLVSGQWYRFSEGALRNVDGGSAAVSMDVSDVRLPESLNNGSNQENTMRERDDKPTQVRTVPVEGTVRAAPGAPLQLTGTAPGQGAPIDPKVANLTPDKLNPDQNPKTSATSFKGTVADPANFPPVPKQGSNTPVTIITNDGSGIGVASGSGTGSGSGSGNGTK